jgi:hypothetical protein
MILPHEQQWTPCAHKSPSAFIRNVLRSCDIHCIIKDCYESSCTLCGCTCHVLVSACKHGVSQLMKLTSVC